MRHVTIESLSPTFAQQTQPLKPAPAPPGSQEKRREDAQVLARASCSELLLLLLSSGLRESGDTPRLFPSLLLLLFLRTIKRSTCRIMPRGRMNPSWGHCVFLLSPTNSIGKYMDYRHPSLLKNIDNTSSGRSFLSMELTDSLSLAADSFLFPHAQWTLNLTFYHPASDGRFYPPDGSPTNEGIWNPMISPSLTKKKKLRLRERRH